MNVKSIFNLKNTEREVKGVGFTSIRVLLESDNMGFGMNKTLIPKGGPYHWHYKHHLEACYCIQGYGILTDLATGKKHEICPDEIYILDNNDDHTFEAIEDIILISVFNPPLKGNEVHKPDGSYSHSDEFFDYMEKHLSQTNEEE